MKGDRGVVYVAYGLQAARSIKKSIAALKVRNRLPIVILSDNTDLDISGTKVVRLPLTGSNIQRSRQAKLQMLKYVPNTWKYVLYLDADTEVQDKLDKGFEFLKVGWDLALTPSTSQDNNLFRHIGDCEKVTTIEVLQNPFPLQLQAGVMFIKKSKNVESFFETWYSEWHRFKGQDQAAMLRALDKNPIRILLLGRVYNGGDIVKHYFGRAR